LRFNGQDNIKLLGNWRIQRYCFTVFKRCGNSAI